MTQRIIGTFAALISGLILLSGFNLTAVDAQSGIVWTVEYFVGSNYNFTGTPIIGSHTSTSTSAINLAWGTNPPVSGAPIPADNYSARFSNSAVSFTAGSYRFSLRADRNARVFLNNVNILDTASASSTGATVEAVVSVSGGSQTMRVEYFEDTGDAYILLTWGLANTTPTSTPTATSTGGSSGSSGSGTSGGTSGGSSTTTSWTAQFYPNITVSGSPVYTATVNVPAFNWGTGSPNAAVPADNFSAKFTAIENFSAGIYRFELRADDGVRVIVGGSLVIDHWYPSPGSTTYVANVQVFGATSVTVEYYEGTGNALIYYNVARAADGTTPTTSIGSIDINAANNALQLGNTSGKVTAGTLNVREQPFLTAAILTKIRFGEFYSVIGVTADRTWYQIRIGDRVGWVSANFLELSSGTVPTTNVGQGGGAVSPTAVPAAVVASPTGFSLTANANLIIRNQPTPRSGRGGAVPAGGLAPILGRNSTATWFYIDYNFQRGWVSGLYVTLPANINLGAIPILAQ
jgi:uncharacterized protein YraI